MASKIDKNRRKKARRSNENIKSDTNKIIKALAAEGVIKGRNGKRTTLGTKLKCFY